MASLVRNLFNSAKYLRTFNTSYITNVNKSLLPTIQHNICIKQFSNYANPTPHEIVDSSETAAEDKKLAKDIFQNVNDLLQKNTCGRLFAVVHLAGKQFKITEGDVIIIEGYWPPDIGDKIKLDKVLLVGSKDFTLIGRPLVQTGAVNVQATVIEKTVSHTKTNFKKKRRKQYKKIHFFRIQQTMLRINEIKIIDEINNPPDVSIGTTRV